MSQVPPSDTLKPEEASPEQIFTEVFRTNDWGSRESFSGPGSELRQTVEVREAVSAVIDGYGVRTVLDIGCGDFNWQPHVPALGRLDWYVGVDVVADLIALNERRNVRANVHFQCWDATRNRIPRADLTVSRDCMVHLGNAQVLRILQGIVTSGTLLLLATTYPAEVENRDTNGGHWRPINLSAPPFNFPNPVEFYDTDFRDGGRNHPGNGLGLWDLQNFPIDKVFSGAQGVQG